MTNDSKLRGVFRRVWFKVFPPAPKYRKRQGWYW